MVVNSLSFLLFFIVVFIVYYLPASRKNHKFQNFWLFITSYFFYGYADWKMIPLLVAWVYWWFAQSATDVPRGQ